MDEQQYLCRRRSVTYCGLETKGFASAPRQLRTEIETARVQRQEDETKSQKLAELAKVKKTAAVERSKSVKLGKQVATLRSQLKK